MSVAIRGVNPDPPQPSDNWSQARALAYLEKIQSQLPSWMKHADATFDLDSDGETALVSVRFFSVPLKDFDDAVDTRIHVLNQAMVRS